MASAKQSFLTDPEFSYPSAPMRTAINSAVENKLKIYEKIIAKVPSLIAVYNINTGKYIFVNDYLTQILGYSKETFLQGGIPFVASLVHPDDFGPMMEKNNEALKLVNSKKFIKSGEDLSVNFEFRMKHINGTWVWLHTDGAIFDRNKFGKVEHVMNISIDITKRKEKEAQEIMGRQFFEENLRKSQEMFRALWENSADAITLLDVNGKRLFSTPSRKNILGYNTRNDYGNSVFDYIHPDDKPLVLPAFREISMKAGKSMTMVFRVMHQKGHWVWVEATGKNLLHVPEVKAMVVNYRNITDRKTVEDQINFLENASKILISSIDYETTIKNIANLIVPSLADFCRIMVKDENGAIKEATASHFDNERVELVSKLYEKHKGEFNEDFGTGRILKTGNSELVSKVTPQLLKRAQSPNLAKQLKTLHLKTYMGVPLIARGKVIGAITLYSSKDDVFYGQHDLSFAQELAGRVALAIDNAMLYTKERQSVKLRDQFISVASHELKTPITSIKGFVQIAKMSAISPKTRYCMTRLDGQIDKLTDLINDLLDVSRIQQGKLNLHKEHINLNPFLQEIIADIQQISEKHIIIFNKGENTQIWVDRYRLSQVMLNLLTNAIKYSPKSDKIYVSTEVLRDQVLVRVQDFGIGIFPKNIDKIFEPFFQVDTKVRQSYGGLGLGLHISQEIVKRHSGQISVESEKGVGSTFTVSLPR